jgi:hypothetical protein
VPPAAPGGGPHVTGPGTPDVVEAPFVPTGTPPVVTGVPTLPTTGIDLGGLTAFGLALVAVGAAALLLLSRSPRPAGRHGRPVR